MFDFGITAVENPCMVPVCKDHWRLYFGSRSIRLGYIPDPAYEGEWESTHREQEEKRA